MGSNLFSSIALNTRRSCVSTKSETYDDVILCLRWSVMPLFPSGTVDCDRLVLFTFDSARTSAARCSPNSFVFGTNALREVVLASNLPLD